VRTRTPRAPLLGASGGSRRKNASVGNDKLSKYTDGDETAPDGVLEIWQKIVVATENHKKIVVGKGGAQLKQIGMAARHEIQDEWGVNARLHLFVRVEKDWENKRESYEEQGLEFKK